MADIREDVLARLATLVASLSGITFAGRNVAAVDDTQLPAIDLFDGGEAADETDPVRLRRGWNQPRRMRMTPLFVLKVQERAEDMGTALNALRAELLKAIADDTELPDLLGDGYLDAPACEQPMIGEAQMGRRPVGEMQVSVTFGYLLYPSNL